jgi:hypothetical protein
LFGDLFEWAAAGCLIASAYLWSGTVLAVAVAGGCLVYFGQVYAGVAIRRKDKKP